MYGNTFVSFIIFRRLNENKTRLNEGKKEHESIFDCSSCRSKILYFIVKYVFLAFFYFRSNNTSFVESKMFWNRLGTNYIHLIWKKIAIGATILIWQKFSFFLGHEQKLILKRGYINGSQTFQQFINYMKSCSHFSVVVGFLTQKLDGGTIDFNVFPRRNFRVRIY